MNFAHLVRKIRVTLRVVVDRCHEDLLVIHSSALAYTTVLSLVPMFAMAYFALDAFGGLDSMQGKLQDFIVQNLAPAFGNQLLEHIQSIRERISSGALGVFGLIGFVYTSITMLAKVEHCFNGIWRVQSHRPWFQKVTLYWTAMTLGPILIGFGVFLTGQGIALLKESGAGAASFFLFIWTFSPYLVSCLMFAGLFLLMPAKRVGRKSAFLAGSATALVFEIMKQGYGAYATNVLGRSVYGSLAVIPVFLVWIQLVWFIVLLGAELCCYLDRRVAGAANVGLDSGLSKK